MQFATTLLATILSTIALAAPAPAPETVSMMAAVPEWTITAMKRTCNDANTSCTWAFGIDTHLVAATPCTFTVTGSPASRTSTSGQVCGAYTVSSGWSGQFGDGNGFTALSVVDSTNKLIVWPAYTDNQLVSGVVVSPDQSYAPATLG